MCHHGHFPSLFLGRTTFPDVVCAGKHPGLGWELAGSICWPWHCECPDLGSVPGPTTSRAQTTKGRTAVMDSSVPCFTADVVSERKLISKNGW